MLLTSEKIADEMGGGILEITRAVAQGRLEAITTNPDESRPGSLTQPRLRFTEDSFQAFASSDLRGFKIPPGFIDAKGKFLSTDTKAENQIVNMLFNEMRSTPRREWISLARRVQTRQGYRRLTLVKEVTKVLTERPEEADAAILSNTRKRIGMSPETFAGKNAVISMARKIARDVIAEGLPSGFNALSKIDYLDRLYWSPSEYRRIVGETRRRLLEKTLTTRSMKLEGNVVDLEREEEPELVLNYQERRESRQRQAEEERSRTKRRLEGKYKFYASASITVVSLLSRQLIDIFLEEAF